MANAGRGRSRAIWKGVIRVGDLRLPVKLYSAVSEGGVHFRLLHRADQVPIRQHMVDPETGKPVPSAKIRKGFEVEPGVFVVLSDEELARLAPKESRDVRVTRFVDVGTIGHAFYERPYYLGPDRGSDTAAYVAFAEALAHARREGVVHWVMRKKEYVGALHAKDGVLILTSLRFVDEVIPADALEPPSGGKLDAKELALAEQLVSALEADFDPTRFHDEYRERVLELIQRKARGGRIRLRRVRPKPPTRALASALRASLAQASRERRRASA
jgi:DNA end-binding protein Ku